QRKRGEGGGLAPFYVKQHKSRLKEKFQRIHEGISNQGISTSLHEIYTELYITEGGSGEVSNEHEVRQIETQSRRPETQERPIKCNDIFKPLPRQNKSIRTVLTKGVAGIGKTVSVQKFVLDWTEGKANQDLHFIFPLPFRELNLIKESNLSLINLIHHFFTHTNKLSSSNIDDFTVLFIFDGLDECRLPLDFQNNDILCDVTESASLDGLLTNLIKGNLLPSALFWITSRPAAASQIPPECVDQVTDVRGFNDPQKDEYFRKKINDQSLASKIIAHIKSSRSLHIMCHIPVFCWISATVLERILSEAESAEIPKTLTQMFTHFLIFQLKLKSLKYDGKCDVNLKQARSNILSLGKLAFQQLEKGNLVFYEEDLRKCGIDVRDASVYSGVCTQIFREEFGLYLGKVYSFVHLSIQEFLAALYVFLCFFKQTGFVSMFRSSLTDSLKSEVDKALQSENGHLDLFLRFLLGLSLESNHTLLRGLLKKTRIGSRSEQEIVEYIKMKIRENSSSEKSINLFHCLNELNDDSLVQEVQIYLSTTGDSQLSAVKLSPSQWSALVFVLLTSEEKLDDFKLRKYHKSEECLLSLLPVIKASTKADYTHPVTVNWPVNHLVTINILHISRSLHIMCHIPVFCWISATVLERILSEAESAEIPKTLTQMFTHFLIFQLKLKSLKYDGKCDVNLKQARSNILSLGKLAFQQLEKGNLVFYEEDLRKCGIDVRDASVYSGVCTQIFREEFGLYLGKVYSFVHLSIQEFLAALYVFLCFFKQTGFVSMFRSSLTDSLKSEVDKALQSENGHLDLFLRFLLGLSLESNHTLLRGLLKKTRIGSRSEQEIVEYIKMKIRENSSSEKSINLFHCLNELNDDSLVQEVQIYLSTTGDSQLSAVKLSPSQWSALVFVLLTSEEKLDDFKLRKYHKSEECLLSLLPVIKASTKAE
uniref:NACHT domain-containing protein n=1 Tax=Sinocyclocheilus grahami TaxID=75366 RepID=A0A672MK34_SINGR